MFFFVFAAAAAALADLFPLVCKQGTSGEKSIRCIIVKQIKSLASRILGSDLAVAFLHPT
jgi:hypothetical protein